MNRSNQKTTTTKSQDPAITPEKGRRKRCGQDFKLNSPEGAVSGAQGALSSGPVRKMHTCAINDSRTLGSSPGAGHRALGGL